MLRCFLDPKVEALGLGSLSAKRDAGSDRKLLCNT